MKILYLGTYREMSGWGEASRADLKALIKGFDIVCRPIIYGAGAEKSQLVEIEEIETKPIEDVTHVIQYCLPEQWKRYGTMKHIGYLEVESYDLNMGRWTDYFNVVDEIWVPNSDALFTIKQTFKSPIKYVPHAVDLDVYKNSYNIAEIPEISGTFKFFCTSENVPRKNLEDLIAAFWVEFDPTEPVSLIIKTQNSIADTINSVKRKLRLYDIDVYQKIILITDKLSTNQMMGLYQNCDCYVNTSMGESWCLPIVHAMGFNKPIISPFRGGPSDLLCEYQPFYGLHTYPTYCEGHNPNIKGFQTGHDTWNKPMFSSITHAMRMAYSEKPNVKNCIEKFSKERFIENVHNLFS